MNFFLNKLNNSLRTKVALAILICISSTIAFFTYIEIKDARINSENETETAIKREISSYSSILSGAVWAIDSSQTKSTLKEIVENQIVQKAYVFDDTGALFLAVNKNEEEINNNLNIKDILKIKSIDEIKDKAEIYTKKLGQEERIAAVNIKYKNLIISPDSLHVGYLVVEYSTKFISKKIDKIKTELISLTVFLCALMISIILLLLEFFVLRHVLELEEVSKKVSENKFEKVSYHVSKILGDDEINRLKRNYNSMIDQFLKFVTDQKTQERMKLELETAKIIQKCIIPRQEKETSGLLEFTSFYKPATECGGDWWGYYRFKGGKLLLIIGDVTGHGTASAMVTVLIKGYCDSLKSRDSIGPGQILEEIDQLFQNVNFSDRYMTMFCALIDPMKYEITYANAAHNFPYIIKKHGDKLILESLIVSGNLLGGAVDDTKQRIYEEKKAPFNKEDVLFLYTDGIIDLENNEGVNLSERKLKKILQNLPDLKNIENMSKYIRDQMESFNHQNDDVTFILCKYSV